MDGIRIVVAGAAGKMGQEVIKGIGQCPEMELVGAVDITGIGEDVGRRTGRSEAGIQISGDLEQTLVSTRAAVLVDFTHPDVVAANLGIAITRGVAAVVGTTGLSPAQREMFHLAALERGVGVLIAPNFALGVVLLMQFCQQAARYFPDVEIIERHHAGKADAPSGTALQIVDFVTRGRQMEPLVNRGEIEKIPGARGGTAGGVRLHSLRLPGSVAHHEVIFGGDGQSLTIKHDSLSRDSFLPGVLLAIRKVPQIRGVVFGLENILDDIHS